MKSPIRSLSALVLLSLLFVQSPRAQDWDFPPINDLLLPEMYNRFTKITLTPITQDGPSGLVTEVQIAAEADMVLRHQLEGYYAPFSSGVWFPGDYGELFIDTHVDPTARAIPDVLEIDTPHRFEWQNSVYYRDVKLRGSAIADLRMREGPHGMSSVRNIASAKLVRRQPHWNPFLDPPGWEFQNEVMQEVLLPVPWEVSAYVTRHMTQSEIPVQKGEYPERARVAQLWVSVAYENVSNQDHLIQVYRLERKFPGTWKPFGSAVAEAGTSGLRTVNMPAQITELTEAIRPHVFKAVIYPVGTKAPVPPPPPAPAPKPMPSWHLQIQ